jgi:ribosomal protein S18 acetylase RimI-like enzyme
MDPGMTPQVRPMTAADISVVQGVERLAGSRFRDCEDAQIARCADAPVFTSEELSAFIEAGRVFVATDNREVVGFIVLNVVDGCAHVDEVAVVPHAGRRGYGTALIDAVQHWGEDRGLPAVTLTTFRDVPWNGPWYRKLGFRELGEHEWTATLRDLREAETRHGLPPDLRIVMRRDARNEDT